ncbi:hypothetical protein M0R45_009521 [Rubus argutus]|uniref:C-JID domain-containing protein n=1 Tax=Rubus argutus TaxID=59490 RepID=A0AAW1Y4Y9_RUBAR
MHDLIQEMALEIVRRESREPGFRSRLCHRNDIFHVFQSNTGTEAIKGIRLCLPKLEEADSRWNCESFSRMSKLTFLELDNLIIHSGPKSLPDSLRILKWGCKLVRLWDGKQDLPYLKRDFAFSSTNCFGLADDEGWNNAIFSLLRRVAIQGISPKFSNFSIVSPGSKIPNWFNIQSEGDSLIVELPADQNSMWMGIAFCVVFAEPENPAALKWYVSKFDVSRKYITVPVGL